ncbi:unnamed protein product, partial [Rotaria socialis]
MRASSNDHPVPVRNSGIARNPNRREFVAIPSDSERFRLDPSLGADELDPLSDYLKGKILFAKIKFKTISTTTSTSHIVDDTFGDTLGEKIILAGIGSFVTAVTSYIFVCLYKFLRNGRHFKVCNFNNSYTVNSCSTYMFLEKLVYTKNPSIPPTPPA